MSVLVLARRAPALHALAAWLALWVLRVVALLAALALFVLWQAGTGLAVDQVGTDTSLRVVQTLNVVAAVFLPILVALVTRSTTSAAVKAWLLAALTVAGSLLTSYIAGPAGFDWWGAGLTAVVSFVTAVASYHGLWKPTGVAAAANRTLTG